MMEVQPFEENGNTIMSSSFQYQKSAKRSYVSSSSSSKMEMKKVSFLSL